MSQFTSQELDLLIDALGVWELSKCRQPHPVEALIRGMLPACDDPECPACRHSRAEAAEAAQNAKLASERSILLRAKLIGLRDSLAADKVFDEAQTKK